VLRRLRPGRRDIEILAHRIEVLHQVVNLR
jgi:hypothetical protein